MPDTPHNVLDENSDIPTELRIAAREKLHHENQAEWYRRREAWLEAQQTAPLLGAERS